MSEITLDQERQEKARVYARIRRRLFVLDMAIGAVYLLLWLLTGWSTALRNSLLGVTSNQFVLVALFGVVFGGIYTIINLPLTYYSGFILPHRFEISTQTLKGWIGDQLKGLGIGILIGGILVEIAYLVLRTAPTTWWLWLALILLVFNVLLTNLAPVLIMPLFNKFVPLDESYADLEERLMKLAERANTKVRGVYKFDMSARTKAANAALAGLGSTRRIILGDTLLNEFTSDEIETVLAHELGHEVHRDIPLFIVTGSLITLAGLFLAALGLDWGVRQFGFSAPGDVAAMPLLALIMGLFGLITMPLENAISRWREKMADEYALSVTHKAEAFASAMIRLGNQNLAEADPESWVEFLLYSHPALNKRIAMAEQAAQNPSYSGPAQSQAG